MRIISWAIVGLLCAGCKVWAPHAVRIDNRLADTYPTVVIAREAGTGHFTLNHNGTAGVITRPLAILSADVNVPRIPLDAPRGTTRQVAWSPDDTWVAIAPGEGRSETDPDQSIRICSAETGRQTDTVALADGAPPSEMLVLPAGDVLIWCRSGASVIAYSIQSGETAALETPDREGRLLISANGRTGCRGRSIFRIETSPHLRLVHERDLAMVPAALSPDGTRAYSVDYLYWLDPLPALRFPVLMYYAWRTSGWSTSESSYSREVALYEIDVSSGAILTRREFVVAHEYAQTEKYNIHMKCDLAAVSPDGNLIALASLQGIHLIDLRANRELAHLMYDATFDDMGHRVDPGTLIESVSFSPDGKRVFCGDSPEVGAYIWNVP